MSLISTALRPFWMPKLNAVSGIQKYRLNEWIAKEDYIVTQEINAKNSFVLDITDPEHLLSSFAFDCNRLACASFESMYMTNRDLRLSRSYAWLLIKSYYAAFFAAHSILRILGKSCTQLGSEQIKSVNKIAKLYDVDKGVKVLAGYYYCTYIEKEQFSILRCKNIKGEASGSHESFWKQFIKELETLSIQILSSSHLLSQESQTISLRLDEVRRNLCLQSCNGGNWLSYVRNTVNYRHELDAWFPHPRRKRSLADTLYEQRSAWLEDPLEIDLSHEIGTDLLAFMRTCSFIVGWCRVLIEDMSSRCSSGTSFLTYGPLRLLNVMSQPTSA